MTDILTLDVAKAPLIYMPKYNNIVVRHEFGAVIVFIGQKRVELTTMIAHDIGYAIHSSEKQPDEMVVLSINGEKIELLWPIALKLATALLRKADDADDFQIRRMT